MKNKDLAVVLPAVAGTYLESVFKTMISGQFVEEEMPAIKDGEIVIAGMTLFQKSLHSFLNQYGKDIKEFNKFLETLEKTKENDELVEKKFAELDAAKEDCAAVGRLMWKSIGSNPAAAGKSLGIRAGYVVVSRPKANEDEEDCGCMVCQLKKIIGEGLGNADIIIASGFPFRD